MRRQAVVLLVLAVLVAVVIAFFAKSEPQPLTSHDERAVRPANLDPVELPKVQVLPPRRDTPAAAAVEDEAPRPRALLSKDTMDDGGAALDREAARIVVTKWLARNAELAENPVGLLRRDGAPALLPGTRRRSVKSTADVVASPDGP